ncbi:unnamed protein product [Rhodiola kirilowii]
MLAATIIFCSQLSVSGQSLFRSDNKNFRLSALG